MYVPKIPVFIPFLGWRKMRKQDADDWKDMERRFEWI